MQHLETTSINAVGDLEGAEGLLMDPSEIRPLCCNNNNAVGKQITLRPSLLLSVRDLSTLGDHKTLFTKRATQKKQHEKKQHEPLSNSHANAPTVSGSVQNHIQHK